MMSALLVLGAGRPSKRGDGFPRGGRETGTRLGLAHGTGCRSSTSSPPCSWDRRTTPATPSPTRAGGETRFVGLMNARAREVGLRGTRFANACGTTPRDALDGAGLARLAEAAMGNPVFARMAGLEDGWISTADAGKKFPLENKTC